MSKSRGTPKIGAGHGWAFLRQGAEELRNGLYTGSNIAVPTPYGIWGTKLPSEVAQERAGNVMEPGSPDHETSILDQHVRAARGSAQADRGQDRDRDRDVPERD